MTIVVPSPAGSNLPEPDDERFNDADLLPDDDDDSTELETLPDVWEPSAAGRALARVADRPLPTLRQCRQRVVWYGRTVAATLPRLLVFGLPVLLAQGKPIWMGGWKILQAIGQWRCKVDWEADIKHAEGNARLKGRERFEKRKRSRSIVVGVGAGGVAVGLAIGLAAWLYQTLLALGAVLCILDIVGRRDDPDPGPNAILPPQPLREGVPPKFIAAQVESILVDHGHEPTVAGAHWTRYGLVMELHAGTAIGDTELEAIERGLQAFPGAVSRIQSASNAAIGELRIMVTDPLAEIRAPAMLAPLSQTVNNPGVLGYGFGGADLTMNFLRTNILVVGGPGSGKSSCFWCMIDYLTACRDVVVDGIDISGAAALDTWGDCIRNFANNYEDAKELLHEALTRADRRTRKVAGRSRPKRGGGPVGSENWGTADGPAHVILIDELPVLARYKDLMEMYSEHQRIGRKAACTSVAATQDLSGDTIKATSVRKYPSTLVLLACSREDVSNGLGGKKIAQGWCPHRFIPAEGDNANDAGKAFIHSGTSRTPSPWRFNRMEDVSAIHERVFARLDAGMPTLDDNDEPFVAEGLVLPDSLALFENAFRDAGYPDFMATADILSAIAASHGKAPSEKRLAEMGREFGIERDPTRRRSAGHPNARAGYRGDTVRDAIARWERGQQ